MKLQRGGEKRIRITQQHRFKTSKDIWTNLQSFTRQNVRKEKRKKKNTWKIVTYLKKYIIFLDSSSLIINVIQSNLNLDYFRKFLGTCLLIFWKKPIKIDNLLILNWLIQIKLIGLLSVQLISNS